MKLCFVYAKCLFAIILFTNCNSAKKVTSKTNNIMQQDSGANSTPAQSLTGVNWKLIELMGKPVTGISTDGKEIHIKFISEGNRVEGFGGCNGFGGNYSTKNDFNISLTNIIGTMIACPDLDTENELFNTLRNIDNYYVKNDTLSISKARMATMAKFIRM